MDATDAAPGDGAPAGRSSALPCERALRLRHDAGLGARAAISSWSRNHPAEALRALQAPLQPDLQSSHPDDYVRHPLLDRRTALRRGSLAAAPAFAHGLV